VTRGCGGARVTSPTIAADRATALHYFVRHDHAPAEDPALCLRVLRGLVERGAEPDAQNTNGESALHIAALHGVFG